MASRIELLFFVILLLRFLLYHALSEYLTTQFYAWEQRGRGWKVFDQPVELESEFVPFFGHFPPERTAQVMTEGGQDSFRNYKKLLGCLKQRRHLHSERKHMTS